ncbi:hypothetical protein G6F31_018906 [Rhizopus arrhizus]|nr:hypothetical protein G6F31_018906 [Rhizopus arrhizus]
MRNGSASSACRDAAIWRPTRAISARKPAAATSIRCISTWPASPVRRPPSGGHRLLPARAASDGRNADRHLDPGAVLAHAGRVAPAGATAGRGSGYARRWRLSPPRAAAPCPPDHEHHSQAAARVLRAL